MNEHTMMAIIVVAFLFAVTAIGVIEAVMKAC